MMQFTMVGAEPLQKTPPPEEFSYEPIPLLILKPSITDASSSPQAKVTTDPSIFPSIIVTYGPSSLRTVIAFPQKEIFSA